MPTDSASEGGCLCRAVRYRIVGEPRSSSVCFCRSCRLVSGAASVAWFVVRRDQFALLSGTPIAYQHTDDPHAIELTTATLDDPQRFPPTREIWHRHRLAWAASDPRLPHFSGDSGGEPATQPAPNASRA